MSDDIKTTNTLLQLIVEKLELLHRELIRQRQSNTVQLRDLKLTFESALQADDAKSCNANVKHQERTGHNGDKL